MEVVIEIVEPGRKAPSVQRLSKEEIIVGRAWNSDLILSDEEVEPQHLCIQIDVESNHFLLKDLHSAHGVRVDGKRIDQKSTPKYGDLITVGQTSFRIHRPSDVVAPVTVRNATENMMHALSRPLLTIALAMTVIVLQQYVNFLSAPAKIEWENMLSSALNFSIFLVFWGIFWGGITKLFKHQVRIWTHLGLASLVWIFYLFLQELQTLVLFNTLSQSIADISQAGILSVSIFAWIFLALIVISSMRARTRSLIAACLVGLYITTYVVIPRFQVNDYVDLAPLQVKSMHPNFLLRGTDSSEAFMHDVTASFERTDAQAQKKREESLKNKK